MTTSHYLPILELRPAEMLALAELPNKDKDVICPLFRLRPWTSARTLDKATERLSKAFGHRPAYLELAEPEYVEPGKRRTVHDELQALRDPRSGFQNWVSYLAAAEHSHFIPVLQLGGSPEDFRLQVENMNSLGRGIAVRIPRATDLSASALGAVIAAVIPEGAGATFILDYGKQSADFPARENQVSATIEVVRRVCGSARIALSASSFPESFVGLEDQPIYERVLYERLVKKFPRLVYSDRGSARVERQLGGGGLPAPRIDYAKKSSWHFYRQASPAATAFLGYQAQAQAVIQDSVWDKGLKLWACQMIERTAAGDSEGGISSPNRATAARINLHLHRQINFYDEDSFLNTDEDWID